MTAAGVYLAVCVLLAHTTPSAAQSTSLVCDHTALRAPLPAEAFNIDLAGRTVQGRDTKVPASVSGELIEWRSNSTLYTLDRRSNVLIRVVLGEYATVWRCR
jgi:hypothetical protein